MRPKGLEMCTLELIYTTHGFRGKPCSGVAWDRFLAGVACMHATSGGTNRLQEHLGRELSVKRNHPEKKFAGF